MNDEELYYSNLDLMIVKRLKEHHHLLSLQIIPKILIHSPNLVVQFFEHIENLLSRKNNTRVLQKLSECLSFEQFQNTQADIQFKLLISFAKLFHDNPLKQMEYMRNAKEKNSQMFSNYVESLWKQQSHIIFLLHLFFNSFSRTFMRSNTVRENSLFVDTQQ